MKHTKTYLLAFSMLWDFVQSAHILGIFPIAAKSSFSYNHAILKSLHEAGHRVTMITPFPSAEKKTENFTYVDSAFDSFIYVGQSKVEDFLDMPFNDLVNLRYTMGIKYCYDVMKLKEIQEALHSSEKLYDVLLIEVLVTHECYLPLAEKLGVPVIGTLAFHAWKLADNIVGLPNTPAILPLTGRTVRMNIFERVENLWNNFIVDYYAYKTSAALEQFYRQHYYNDGSLSSSRSKKDVSIIFYNNHATLLSRPNPPNAINVAGIHVQPSKPLPQDIQKFIDEAPRGVILFTFGSVVTASSLPTRQKAAFLAAFASVPQRVIWKFEEPVENVPKNVMLRNWLPQRDILEHKNVIAFISHGGQSGTYEAVITGTPVITIPIYGDQARNAANLCRCGVGVNLDLRDVSEQTVLEALDTIINDTSYYQRMQELSYAFKDRPHSPRESIVYWTEYVIRHGGAPFLKPLGVDMPLYKYLMLDILALVVLISSIVLFAVYAATTRIRAIISKSKNSSTKKLK